MENRGSGICEEERRGEEEEVVAKAGCEALSVKSVPGAMPMT